jgi:mono/diheme cytochrome c family protein
MKLNSQISKKLIIGIAVISCIALQSLAFAQSEGQTLFQSSCMACHTIGKGRLVGPDLADIHTRRSEKWIVDFVTSSQSLVKSGDKQAVAIFEEYNKMVMPDQPLSVAQIKSIIAYIRGESSGDAAVTAPKVSITLTESNSEDVALGQDLFQGKIRFHGGGPACNSCHHVKNDAVIGGGVLAKELTTVFSRLNEPGVSAILGSPPFPVMKEAYKDKALTEEEVRALVAFLQYADKEHFYQQPRDYGVRLFYTGLGGAVIVFVFFGLVGRRRKKKSVNQDIYDRQIKSE